MEAALKRRKYTIVRSENQLWCCLMKDNETNSACISRKGERDEKVISWGELKGFGTRWLGWWRKKDESKMT